MPVNSAPIIKASGELRQGAETGSAGLSQGELATSKSRPVLSPVGAPCSRIGWAHQTDGVFPGLCLFESSRIWLGFESQHPPTTQHPHPHPHLHLHLRLHPPWDPTRQPSSSLPCAPCPQSILHTAVVCHADGVVSETAMSDEVSDFLRSVELLKERREEEDEARSR